MKIVHTSDWHLGRTLYGKKRYAEHAAFLTWLADMLAAENATALLVAGDIFDNTTPSNRAQELYYRFLCEIANSGCRHVVITAGNHDSPSFLDAPRALLRFLNIYVVGSKGASPGDEVLLLKDAQGTPEILVCAVPYLRDRDLRQAEAGESTETKEQKLRAGMQQHYQEVVEVAVHLRAQFDRPVPIVAMGHLFTAGGKTMDGDGVRDLYVGSLGYVGAEIFPAEIDYLALGHLHVPQKVGGKSTYVYSGSPLPMGFGEAKQEKSVVQVVFNGLVSVVRRIPVPKFQALESINGDWPEISARLKALKQAKSTAWLEVIYTGDALVSDLRERLDEAIQGTDMEILRVKNTRILEQAMGSVNLEETLDDLPHQEVFRRCLEAHAVPLIQRTSLLQTYEEAVTLLLEEDAQAE